MLSSTLLNSKRQLQNPPCWMGRSPPFRRSLAPLSKSQLEMDTMRAEEPAVVFTAVGAHDTRGDR